MIEKIFNWLKESSHWVFLIAGFILGILSDSTYCAALVGLSVASVIELQSEWKWDWIRWGLILSGVFFGQLFHMLIF